MLAAMLRFLSAAALILALVTSPLAAAPGAPAVPDAALKADLHCAAAFAIAASEQARGSAAALALPALAVRGKRFFADTGARAVEQGGMTQEAVRALLIAEVTAMQRRAAADPANPEPDRELAGEVRPCLARLDAAVPPLQTPDLAQCAAILTLAWEEERTKGPDTAAARDLQTLAQVLATRARDAQIAAGKSGDGADAAVEAARDAMRAEVASRPGGVDNYDIRHCYDLAAPDAKSHY
ncbi:hypothetical protein [Novosphingobium sp.]|uniref:hypothetical protein n=1 Tax=Novosphingobium sp. TaxID=1874826 RepID=UPI0026039E70|nr:hypothetical protein [Novosphingobium sp.]